MGLGGAGRVKKNGERGGRSKGIQLINTAQ